MRRFASVSSDSLHKALGHAPSAMPGITSSFKSKTLPRHTVLDDGSATTLLPLFDAQVSSEKRVARRDFPLSEPKTHVPVGSAGERKVTMPTAEVCLRCNNYCYMRKSVSGL